MTTHTHTDKDLYTLTTATLRAAVVKGHVSLLDFVDFPAWHVVLWGFSSYMTCHPKGHVILWVCCLMFHFIFWSIVIRGMLRHVVLLGMPSYRACHLMGLLYYVSCRLKGHVIILGCHLMWLVASRNLSSYGACRLIGHVVFLVCCLMGHVVK